MHPLRMRRLCLLAGAVAGTIPSFVWAQSFNWTFNNGNTAWTASWATNSNWSPNTGFPNSTTANVVFPSTAITGGPGTVLLDTGVSVGTVHFSSSGANNYLLAGAGTLTLAANGAIDVTASSIATIATAMNLS